MTSRIRLLARPLGGSLVLALLAGGSPTPLDAMAGPPPKKAASRFTTHVFVGTCIMPPKEQREEFFGGLIAAVVPSLISTAFNRFGNALDAAGKEYTWQTTAFTNFEVNKDNMPRCVQLVRGEFLAPERKGRDANAPIAASRNDEWADTIDQYKGKGGQLESAGIRLARRPDFFFEGVFRESTDASVMAIVPIFVDFTEPIGDRALRSDKKRNISLTFAFHPPGKLATDATNPSTNLVLGELSPGALIDFDYSCAKRHVQNNAAGSAPNQPGGAPGQPGRGPSEPFAPSAAPPAPGGKPVSSEATPAALKIAPRACADESLWFKLTRGETLSQLSLTVATTEVQGKNEFLMFLSDVFKGSKEGLEKIAQQALIEAEREKARLAAIQASNQAAVAYDEAATTALTALDACSTDGTIVKAGAARVKQQGANLAAAKAGIPEPFSTLVPLNGSADALKKACHDAITSFK
jgi:hypothetical protein